MNTTDVVVTGLGATTPLGGDVPTTWQAALAGASGVRSIEADWVAKYELPVTFAGQLATPASEVLPIPQQRRMDPSAQYAMIAAREAWADAGSPEVDGDRLGAVIASGIGGLWTFLNSWDTLRDRGPRRVLPLSIPMLMANSPAANVSVEFSARAGAHAPVSACASGAEAIAYGMDMIRLGRADIVITGGTEAVIHPLPIAAFAKMQALSTRNDDPQAASRPYDAGRDGFVLGEGSGVVVLESAEHAASRGARIYARLAGTGMTADSYDIAPPDPTGAGQERAMRLALAASGLAASDVAHVNAHATSTPVGDGIEAAAISRTFGEGAAVSGTKSMTGHLLGGAGALEAIFTILALRDRLAPPTINLDTLDPAVSVDVVGQAPRALPSGDIAALNNAFGFGGHNVALLFASA